MLHIRVTLTQRAVSFTTVASPARRCGALLRLLEIVVQPFVFIFTSSAEFARAYASFLVSGAHSSSLFTELAEQLVKEFVETLTMHACTSRANAPTRAQALYAAYVGTLFTWSALGRTDAASLSKCLGGDVRCHLRVQGVIAMTLTPDLWWHPVPLAVALLSDAVLSLARPNSFETA